MISHEAMAHGGVTRDFPAPAQQTGQGECTERDVKRTPFMSVTKAWLSGPTIKRQDLS